MTTYRARYVFPVAAPPIGDGEVEVDSGTIVYVGPYRGNPGAVDLGNAAILPALVNAHVHLDLSDCPQPLGTPGIGMADWIRLVIASRAALVCDTANAVLRGLEECRRYGVGVVGDIAPEKVSELFSKTVLTPFFDGEVAATVFLELIGPTPERAVTAARLARGYLDASTATHGRYVAGLSPHAPYSVWPDLLAEAVRLSAAYHAPLAMHLAESLEEIELLQIGGGPLRRFLEEIGAWTPGLVTPRSRPLDYLRTLAEAHSVAVIHGNYLDDDEIAFLAARADRMSVVYCPRTHAFFGHNPYPLEKMLAAGVTVALGTDSRASSPDLDLMAELRFVANRYPQVPLATLLRMVTLSAAQAIGGQAEFGSLEPGKSGKLHIVPLSDDTTADPHEMLLGR